MHKVKLTLIESKAVRLRTQTVEGLSLHVPKVGYPFVLLSNPLDPSLSKKLNAYRLVRTSTVMTRSESETEAGNKLYRFRTESESVYEVEIAGREDLEIDPLTQALLGG